MAFAFTVLTLLSLTGSALGGTLFGNSAGYLKAVDLRAGSIEVIGPVDNEEYWVGDLTFSPHKELYGVARHYNGDPDKLVKIDLETAEIIEIGTLDMSGVRGIAFDSNGVLYGAGGEEYRGLIQIDPETCTVTQIGRYRLGKAVVTGLAISPQDELYGVVNEYDHSRLYRIDREMGQAALVDDIGFVSVDCIAFDETGRLFGVAGWLIIEIDPVEGGYQILVDPALWMTGCAIKGSDEEPECPPCECEECPYGTPEVLVTAERIRGFIRQNPKKDKGRVTLRIDYKGVMELERNTEIEVMIRVPNGNGEKVEKVDIFANGTVRSISWPKHGKRK
jgi:hypothetical protein